MPEISEFAPDFTLPRDGGGEITLTELRGAPVVLFFYPRDNTPGCTTEAMDFSGLLADFASIGTQVFGVSRNSIASHDKFRDKHNLRIPLLSDADSDVCETYGVWKEKRMYGKKFMGIERTTVLIDAQGRIAHIWPRVKVPGHAEAVLASAKAL